jgi:hypothetical protein
MNMTIWKPAVVLFAALLPLIAATTNARAEPVAVECALKLKYRVHTERPSVDLANRYTCEGKVVAASDVDAVDAVDKARRQVVFRLDNCLRVPATVVFGSQGVTEVRQHRGTRVKAHVFAGECRGCVMALSTDVAVPRVDSGHFDGTFAVRAVDSVDSSSIRLPAGRGHLTLRSERTDDIIVRAAWTARRCAVVPQPPIFCGGIAGIACPDGLVCVDWREDDCDPDAGGADCIGICVDGSS